MDPILADLNEPQRDAVLYGTGPLMVLAGAGSGKTRVITRRIARLLRDGAEPWTILAWTFTNKAAGEMAKRVRELGGHEVRVSTFHSSCARFLRQHADALGYPRDFSIYDTYDRDSAIKLLMQERDMDLREVRPAAVGRRISQLKNLGMRARDLVVGLGQVDDVVERIYGPYEELMRQHGAMDFDDLLLLFQDLLEGHPEIAEKFQSRYRWVLIDEFQDTNRVQYDIAKKLVHKHRNLCVVGDPDQSIYRFRGAELRNVLDFEQDFPETKVVRLEQNYRSSANILAAAEAVIANNTLRKPKALWTEAEAGAPLTHECFDSPRGEAATIADRVQLLLDDGVGADEIAVFYRSHFLSRGIEEGLRERGIPYRIVGGVSFFERREIKDLVAFLRVLVNPLDDLAMERIINVPPRRIGKQTVKKLKDLAETEGMSIVEATLDPELRARLGAQARKGLEQLAEVLEQARAQTTESASEPLESILEGIGYRDWIGGLGDPEDIARLENVGELVNDATVFDAAHDGGLASYLQHVSLLTSEDRNAAGEPGQAVSLMTVHAAKGLEFEHVFVAGLEDGIFPSQRAIDGGDVDLEEERRLMYVAITRGREGVSLSSCMVRTVQGEMRDQEVSRFVGEIPEEVLEMRGGGGFGGWFEGSQDWERDRDPYADPPDSGASSDGVVLDFYQGEAGDESGEESLAVGTRVVHPYYGQGQVRSVQGRGARAKVTVDFDKVGERLLIVEHAGLQILPGQGSSDW